MKKTTINKALLLTAVVTTTVTGFCLTGCELIVDFDRTKIDAGLIDAGVLIDADGIGDGAVADPDTGANPDPDANAPDPDAGDAQQQPDAETVNDAAADG